MRYLVYLHSIWITQKKLLNIFENSENYEEVFNDIKSWFFEKYDLKDAEKIKELLKILNKKKIDNILKELDVKIITIKDKNYPKNLKNISNPPYFLYVRWNLKENEEYFSIVWSRKISEYAKKAWNEIIPKLTKYFTIVSWWATWCDTLAHNLALKNNAKTIVVFWTWIDLIFPSYNEKLFLEVLENDWALISIFPIWTPGNVYTFPVRNEIVSGISSGVLVLQAGEKSGTLITANLALDQWKDLFAIPGDIFNPDFIWTNELIKNWNAKLVSSSDDILEEYNYKIIKEDKKIPFQNEIEENIFNLLKYNLSLSIDDFLEKTNYSYSEISLNISMMEISGIIKKDLFWKYSINY